MDAMYKLVSFGRGAASALLHVIALLVRALAAAWLAARKFRYA